MRGLRLLLLVDVAVPVLIGFFIIDLGFVFFEQAQLSRERRLELRLAAVEAVALAHTHDRELAANLAALAALRNVTLTLVGPETLSTADPPLALPTLAGGEAMVRGGWEHVAVQAGSQAAYEQVVASRRVDSAWPRIFAMQRTLLLFLAALAALVVYLALLLLRRAVVAPIQRMTRLVSDADRAGLSRLGPAMTSDLGELSRAIIGMTQRLDEDRQHIAGQLEELTAAHARLEAAQQQLLRAERLTVVGRLAAGLAHELGNPLAVVRGYVDLLRADDLPTPDRHDALSHMGREIDRMHSTVRTLLDFSRAPESAGHPGDVVEVAAHVQKLLKPQARMRNVELEVQAPNAPLLVPVDADGLTELLLNLTLNAADAVGGTGRVRVRVETSDADVQITVEDSGPGVPEELRARIFEPFFTTKPAGAGTGLGLSVCERLVSSAGGEISVGTSELGGACFSVRLPGSGSREQ